MTQQYRATKIINRYLDTKGDGSGEKNAIGNYSNNKTVFFIKPENDQVFHLRSIMIHIRAKGTDVYADKYGDQDRLVNGIKFELWNNDGLIADLTDGLPVHDNADLSRCCITAKTMEFKAESGVISQWSFDAYNGD